MICSADVWSDHRLVVARISIKGPGFRPKNEISNCINHIEFRHKLHDKVQQAGNYYLMAVIFNI